jgi:hypothetical protein
MDAAGDPQARAMYRLGGNAAVLLGLSYLVITGLFVVAGPVPSDGQGASYLDYLDGKEAIWWAITGFSVLTDLLFLPLAAALYVALAGANRLLAMIGAALIVGHRVAERPRHPGRGADHGVGAGHRLSARAAQ